MFRWFAVAVGVLALVIILRTPFVQFWVSDIQSMLTNWMYEASLIAERQRLESFREELEPHTQDLKEYQKDYIAEVTENMSALKNFNLRYCQRNDKNPYIYGATLQYVCGEILRTGILESY